MDSEAFPIPYGRASRTPRKRFWIRTLLLVSLAVVIVAAVWLGYRASTAWERWRIQRQCLECVFQPNEVAFEEDKREMTRLLQNGAYAESTLGPPKHLYRSFRPWVRYTLLPPYKMTGLNSEIVFLHERRSRNGTRRLVAVGLNAPPLGGPVDLVPMSIVPAPFGGVPQASFSYADGLQLRESGVPALRVFCGTVDPVDPASFTVVVELGGKRRAIRGELLDSGKVHLEWQGSPP